MKLPILLVLLIVLTSPILATGQTATTQASPELTKSREITATVISLFDGGRYDEALPLAKQALELREHALGTQHQDLIPLLTNLAEINNSLKKYDDAASFFNRALRIAESSYGAQDVRIASILDRLASVEYARKHEDIVERLLIRSLSVKDNALGPNNLEVAQAAYNLAELYRARRDYKKAAPLYERAVEIREQAAEKDRWKLVKALEGYVFVLAALKRDKDASRIQHRLDQLTAERAIKEGGVLNGKALVLVQPDYPTSAPASRPGGRVSVKVVIDENGKVISAKGENANRAHPALVGAAEDAARRSRFSPTFKDGVAIRVTGIIVYNFVRQ